MEGVHGQPSNWTDRLHCGRTTLLAFLMQGWGQLANQGCLDTCSVDLSFWRQSPLRRGYHAVYIPNFIRLHCDLPFISDLYSGFQAQEREPVV